jgi:hypothetical protein
MTRNDHGHPESEEDLEQMRARNNQHRRTNPEEPQSLGDSHRGVLREREQDDNTKAGSGTKGSHPKR